MRGLAKASFLVTLICPTIVAANCRTGSCLTENDEVSLIQINQNLKPSKEEKEEYFPITVNGVFANNGGMAYDPAVGNLDGQAINLAPMNVGPTPITDAKAIVDAMPRGILNGKVQEAFGTNEHMTKSQIQKRTASAINFANQVTQQRKYNQQMAQGRLMEERQKTQKAIKSDVVAVERTKRHRFAVVQNATDKVKVAKEHKLAMDMKLQQVQRAAVQGREWGAAEGKAEANRMTWAYKRKQREEAAADLRKRRRHERHMAKQMHEATVDEETKRIALHDKRMLEAMDKQVDAVKTASAARAAETKEAIEGVEGLKNQMTEHWADRIVKDFERVTESEQKKIDDAAEANYPAINDWDVALEAGLGWP